MGCATEAEIIRLYFAEHWRVGTIAAQLGTHPDVVRRVLGIGAQRAPDAPPRARLSALLARQRPVLEQEQLIQGVSALRPLVLALVERPDARRHREDTQEHLELLARFSIDECEPLRAALLSTERGVDALLPQRDRDRTFLSARRT